MLFVFNFKFVFVLNYIKDVGYVVMYVWLMIDWYGLVV